MSNESRNSTPNRGHFRKGQSGNPAGRPRGARNKTTMAVEALFAGGAPRLTRAVVERALDSGDPALPRYCLVRILPPARRRRVELDRPAGNDADTIAAALAVIVRAVAEGVLSPLEASGIAKPIAARCRMVEMGDLERRVAELENAVNALARCGRGASFPAQTGGSSDRRITSPTLPPRACSFPVFSGRPDRLANPRPRRASRVALFLPGIELILEQRAHPLADREIPAIDDGEAEAARRHRMGLVRDRVVEGDLDRRDLGDLEQLADDRAVDPPIDAMGAEQHDAVADTTF